MWQPETKEVEALVAQGHSEECAVGQVLYGMACRCGVVVPEAPVDALFARLDALSASLLKKAEASREVATVARRRGNLKKWDKFNAVARVYEMNRAELLQIRALALKHATKSLPCTF